MLTSAAVLLAWCSLGATPSLAGAAERGDLETMGRLLASGTPVDAPESNGETPLIRAARSGSAAAVGLLLEHGASVAVVAKDGTTALSAAVKASEFPIARRLVLAGADVNARFLNSAEQPLAAAVDSGDVKLVELMLEKGADLNRQDEQANWLTVLHQAADRQVATKAAIVEALLKHGAKPDVRDRNGTTALLAAASVGALDVVQLLVRHGADVAVLDNLGSSVLDAARRGNDKTAGRTVDALLERYGAQLPEKTRAPYELLAAVRHDDVSAAQALVTRGVSLKEGLGSSTPLGAVALVEAVTAGATASIGWLLHQPRADTQGAVVRATELKRWDLVKLLLEGGAVLEDESWTRSGDCHGEYLYMTALMIAADAGELDVVRLMVEHGAHLDPRKDGKEQSVLLCAVGHPAVVAYLLSKGAKANAPVAVQDYAMLSARPVGPAHVTPLVLAAWDAPLESVELLVKAGASLTVTGLAKVTDDRGRVSSLRLDPLFAAEQRGREQVVAFLLQHGARPAASEERRFALRRFAVEGDLDKVKASLKVGKPTAAALTQALHGAAAGNHPAVIDALLEAKAAVDSPDARSETALMVALRLANVEAAARLLERGAKLDASDGDTQAIVFAARGTAHPAELVELLLAHGVTTENTPGRALVRAAAREGNVDLLRVLGDRGFSLVKALPAEPTPLHVAAAAAQPEAVRFLLANGADARRRGVFAWAFSTVVNSRGPTERVLSVAQQLLAAGASVDDSTGARDTALHQLWLGHEPRLLELLRQRGADRCTPRRAEESGPEDATLDALAKPGWACQTLSQQLAAALSRYPLTAEEKGAAVALATPMAATVITDRLSLRATPAMDGAQLQVLVQGQRGLVLAQGEPTTLPSGPGGRWLLWENGAGRGWVFSAYVGLLPEGLEPTPAYTVTSFEPAGPTFELGQDSGGWRCVVRAAGQRFTADSRLLQVDPGDAEEGTTAMLTTLNGDGVLDPVCISRRERYLRVCPFLSTEKGFVAAGCVDFPGRKLPAVGGKVVGGVQVMDLVGWGSVPTRYVLDAATGAFRVPSP